MKNYRDTLIALSFIGLLSMNTLHANTTKTLIAANNAANTNIIINLTGKLIKLHFHSNISHYADAYASLQPLMVGGAPITGLQAVTTRMLPQPVNMHKETCHSVTASLGNTKKSKKDKIEPCTMKIPNMETLNDYKLTIEKNNDGKQRLIFTKCDTIRLVPLHKGANKKSLSRADSNKYIPKNRSNNATPVQNNVNSINEIRFKMHQPLLVHSQ